MWDRGVYHYTHKEQNERHTVPCPRFIAHMATSPVEQHYSKIPSNKSAGHLRHEENMYGKSLTSPKSRCNTSTYMGGRQRQSTPVILPRCVLKNVPKSPVPSMASNDGEPDLPIDYVQSPITPDNVASHKKEQNDPIQLMIVPEKSSHSNSKEKEKLCNQGTLCGFKSTKNGLELSKVLMNETSSICADREDSDLSGRVSSCSSLYRSCSASFSQLHSSSSSLSLNVVHPSKSEEVFNNRSSRVTELEKTTLLSASECYSNVPSPVLNSNRYYGNTDLYQASSHSVRNSSQASDFASSFDEMWHDRLLHHWPVLPPISPQRAFSESSSVGETDRRSKISQFSNSIQDAFDELEMIAPRTGSSQSSENPQSGSYKDFSSDSDICRYTASLTIGFSDHKESLADFRLALLDHTSCGKKDDPTDIANAWDNTISMDSERDIKEFMSLEGPLLLSASGLLNPHSYERGNNQQNIDTIFTDEEDIDLKSQDELCNQTGLYVYNCGTKDYSFYSNSDSSGPKPDKYIYKEENGNHSNTKSEEIKSQALGRKRPVKLDHSIRQEMERQRLAEESRARAVNMYSKLQSSRPTAIRTAQSMSISRFEDFDFLAKYCIFSQEKLAEYKRAFEAVDTDEDGYLDCLQVLMALKEIVPENALSDAEELYVYRILEIVDYYVTDGLTDLRLFAVMASLAQKIAALDSFMRSLIDHMDFKALELKMCKAKQLFLCNIDAESKSISVEQLLVELKAGGISREHEEAAQLELSHIKKLDILDFLTYLPLFVLIHNSVIANPLDDSRKI